MPPDLDAAIREALCACFPADREAFSRTRAWHGSSPDWSVVVMDDNGVIAHAGVVERKILIGSEKVLVSGVQNVFVMPDLRGRGLFRSVMSAVTEEASRRTCDLGMLFCTTDIAPLYERLGWQTAAGRKVTRIEEGRLLPLPENNIMMFEPIRLSDLPSGDVALQGNDW
jgi:predicted N-acetyltransferase YhbS